MIENTKIDRPIAGAIYSEPVRFEQVTAQEFLDAVDRLLAVDGVEGIAWTQYTPYFNDGDACEFSMHEAGVKLDSRFLPENEDDLDNLETEMYLQGSEDKYFSPYDLYTYPERGNWDNKIYEVNGHSTKEIFEALRDFNSRTGKYETVVRNNFGDHAEVYADANGFRVEEHSHD